MKTLWSILDCKFNWEYRGFT